MLCYGRLFGLRYVGLGDVRGLIQQCCGGVMKVLWKFMKEQCCVMLCYKHLFGLRYVGLGDVKGIVQKGQCRA
jgi:hypothetical protein